MQMFKKGKLIAGEPWGSIFRRFYLVSDSNNRPAYERKTFRSIVYETTSYWVRSRLWGLYFNHAPQWLRSHGRDNYVSRLIQHL